MFGWKTAHAAAAARTCNVYVSVCVGVCVGEGVRQLGHHQLLLAIFSRAKQMCALSTELMRSKTAAAAQVEAGGETAAKRAQLVQGSNQQVSQAARRRLRCSVGGVAREGWGSN